MKIPINLAYWFLLLFGLFGCQTKSTEASKKTVQKEINKTSTLPSTPNNSIFQRFESEINRFDSLDKVDGISKNGILFTGSSSIRMWSSLQKDMSGMKSLNRGFGGATIPEVLHFAGRYIFHHDPQIIVFYCGENDIAEGASPEDVFASFKTFVKIVETRLPKTKLVYISMKPSIARWELWKKYQAGEKLIKNFVDNNSNIAYMDSSLSMLEKNGEVKKDIFINDGLHMNEKGYAGWTEQLKPILEKMYLE